MCSRILCFYIGEVTTLSNQKHELTLCIYAELNTEKTLFCCIIELINKSK